MVFWIAILGAGLFIWLAVRMGFYETWVLLFNVLISIYVSIYLSPLVAQLAPASKGIGSYMTALSMVVLAGACFATLHGLSYVFLTGQFSVTFPRLFDILLSGALGFVIGFLILSFIAVVVTTTPLADQELVNNIGFDSQSLHTNISGIAWWCDLVHSVTGLKADGRATQAAIGRLMAGPHKAASDCTATPADANKPPEPSPPKALPRRPSTTRRTLPPGDADLP